MRSSEWFNGNDETAVSHRVVMRSVGLEVPADNQKPIIGIADSSSDLNPCNLPLRALVDDVKAGILEAGGLPVAFPVISLGEDLMKASSMLYRNLLSIEIEENLRSYPLDGVVLLANCDKSVPGALMGAFSANLPTIMVTAGARPAPFFKGKKVGTYGFVSNFSFYFAHHMSTIEGGMICTDDERFYQICRALRSHGMIREMTNDSMRNEIINKNPDLNKDFIFLRPSHNFRSTELNAVLGLSQLKKLDNNNKKRIDNYNYFMSKLDSSKYVTDLELEGQCNYAFTVILKEPSVVTSLNVELRLKENAIEFRRGMSGGGNQLRQPYIKKHFKINYDDFKVVDHVHNFSWYIGNYPGLHRDKIDTLLNVLNKI